jgi:hypothetical protein
LKKFFLVSLLLTTFGFSNVLAQDASDILTETWSDSNAVLKIIRKLDPDTACQTYYVVELTKNIVFDMPSDVSYYLFSKGFYSNTDNLRDIYAKVYANFLMLTKGLKPGAMKKQMVTMNAPEANFLMELTDTEVAQFIVVTLACRLAGYKLEPKFPKD